MRKPALHTLISLSDLSYLETMMGDLKPSLVTIDPLLGYSGKVNVNYDAEMRPVIGGWLFDP